MRQFSAGIINVTGYIGAEVARLLLRHPSVKLTSVTGRSTVGQKLAFVFPHLLSDLVISADLGQVDIAFSAMPHKESAEAILPLLRQGLKVIDLSADFRLKRVEEYPRWYQFIHPAPELLQKAVYGLPELHRNHIPSAKLVANPGCYSTSAILALAPAFKNGLIDSPVIVDSKSGISGAGRTLKLSSLFAEASDNVAAYSLDGHRHLPEMVQELGALNDGKSPEITFVPHLIPMSRGILSTCYAQVRQGKLASGEAAIAELRRLYAEFYKKEPFVKVVDSPPQTKHTWGANICLIHPTIDIRTSRIIVISCIDNLVKGGAGQAVQNMNLMLGLDETTGLESLPIYP